MCDQPMLLFVCSRCTTVGVWVWMGGQKDGCVTQCSCNRESSENKDS